MDTAASKPDRRPRRGIVSGLLSALCWAASAVVALAAFVHAGGCAAYDPTSGPFAQRQPGVVEPLSAADLVATRSAEFVEKARDTLDAVAATIEDAATAATAAREAADEAAASASRAADSSAAIEDRFKAGGQAVGAVAGTAATIATGSPAAGEALRYSIEEIAVAIGSLVAVGFGGAKLARRKPAPSGG